MQQSYGKLRWQKLKFSHPANQPRNNLVGGTERKSGLAYERVGQLGISKYDQGRAAWPCGVPGGGETPNLMLGLAGIGYFYLRLHDARATPPVVMVGPRSSKTA